MRRKARGGMLSDEEVRQLFLHPEEKPKLSFWQEVLVLLIATIVTGVIVAVIIFRKGG